MSPLEKYPPPISEEEEEKEKEGGALRVRWNKIDDTSFRVGNDTFAPDPASGTYEVSGYKAPTSADEESVQTVRMTWIDAFLPGTTTSAESPRRPLHDRNDGR